MLCFALGFYEALLGLLNPVNKFSVSWIYEYSLFFVNNTVLCFHTLQTMHLLLALFGTLGKKLDVKGSNFKQAEGLM